MSVKIANNKNDSRNEILWPIRGVNNLCPLSFPDETLFFIKGQSCLVITEHFLHHSINIPMDRNIESCDIVGFFVQKLY